MTSILHVIIIIKDCDPYEKELQQQLPRVSFHKAKNIAYSTISPFIVSYEEILNAFKKINCPGLCFTVTYSENWTLRGVTPEQDVFILII